MTRTSYQHRRPIAARIASVAGLALAAAGALAGPVTITPIVVEGDLYTGFPISSGFAASENHAVNNSGRWLVESDTTDPSTDFDGLVVTGDGAAGPRTVLFTQGQALTLPAGASISSFDAITVNAVGNSAFNLFLDGTAGTSFDSGVYFNSMLVIQESTVSTSPAFSPNTPYIGWFEVRINDQDQIMMMASVDDPAIATTVDRAIVIVDNPAGAYTETVVAKEGDQLLPGRSVSDFGTGPHAMAFRNNSRIAFSADSDGDTLDDSAVFLYDGSSVLLAAREGSASGVPGRNWGSLAGIALDVNNSGAWVMRGDLDGATTDDALIIRNGTEIIAQEGAPVPAAIGAFNFTGFGTGSVAIADNGDVFYFGDWDDAVTTQDQGIFVNDTLLVQEGVTQIDGFTLASISAVESNFSVSPNGRYVIFEGVLSDGRDGAFLIDRGGPSCLADFDGNGTVEVPDIFAFLSAWFAQDPSADLDGTPGIGVPDIFFFLSLWFAGCP